MAASREVPKASKAFNSAVVAATAARKAARACGLITYGRKNDRNVAGCVA
jgi:hypothetical protein